MAKKKAKTENTDQEVPAQRTGGLAEHLLESIENCGLSHYEIAKQAKIAPQQIYRFVKDRKTLTLDTVDKILPVIDENFGLKMMGVRAAQNELSRTRRNMLAYIEQLQDAIEDLKSLVLHGLKSDAEAAGE